MSASVLIEAVEAEGFGGGGLVVLDADLEVVQQVPAVLGGAEQVDPGAVGAAGPAGRAAGPGRPG
jgi:hypothetical protein